jgi:hypothetical protein
MALDQWKRLNSCSYYINLVITHVLYHFCDISWITACTIFCSPKFHVVYTCTWRHRLPPDKSRNDSDWFTYCIDMWLLTLLFSLQYLSESCFGNNNKFLLPNPWVVLLFIYPTFRSLKILLTQPFSLRCHLTIIISWLSRFLLLFKTLYLA